MRVIIYLPERCEKRAPRIENIKATIKKLIDGEILIYDNDVDFMRELVSGPGPDSQRLAVIICGHQFDSEYRLDQYLKYLFMTYRELRVITFFLVDKIDSMQMGVMLELNRIQRAVGSRCQLTMSVPEKGITLSQIHNAVSRYAKDPQ